MLAEIVAIITGLGAIVGGLAYLSKMGVFLFKKPLETKQEDTAQSLQDKQAKSEKDGLPHA